MITGVFMACSPDPITPPEEAEIKIYTTEVSFTSEGGTKSISFNSTLDWKVEISSGDSWCKVTPTSGSGGDATITINAGVNSDKSDRSTQLTITSGNVKKTVSIKQTKPEEEVLTVTESEFNVGSDGGEIKIVVKANIDFEYEIAPECKEWISYVNTKALKTSTLVFKISANEEPDGRIGKIIIKSGEIREEITITQKQKDALTVTASTFELDAYGGEIEIVVNSNIDYEYEIRSQDQNWISYVGTKAMKTETLTFSISKSKHGDTREGKIYIKSGNITEEITIIQTFEHILTVNPSEFELDSTGGEISFTIEENLGYWCEIEGEAKNWISRIETDSEETIRMIVSANESTFSRTGRIQIVSGALERYVTVTQKGNESAAQNERNILMSFYEKTGGAGWKNKTNWGSELPVKEWYGILTDIDGYVTSIYLPENNLSGNIPEGLSGLKKLANINLVQNNLTGSIPSEFGNISSMTLLYLANNKISGNIPAEIGNLSQLEYLNVDNNQLTGSIPKEVGMLTNLKRLSAFRNQLSGSIPPEIGNMSSLIQLHLYENNLTGSIPSELGDLTQMRECILWGNNLSGRIPDSVMKLPCWNSNWHLILNQKEFGISEEGINIYIPEFNVTTLSGKKLTNNIVSQNKLTVIYNFLSWCQFSATFTPRMVGIYEMFKDLGLEVFSTTTENSGIATDYIEAHRIPWECTVDQTGSDTFVNYIDRSPVVAAFDSNGLMVFSSALRNYGELIDFLTEKLGSPTGIDPSYKSTDFSKDGEVKQLQKAGKGNGIDVIFMGDAYSDRLVADGTYEKDMKLGMEKFFAAEPYKTYRDLFNVYSITAVSENEAYAAGSSTAINGYFGKEMHVGGNDGKAMEYARKAISENRMNDALIIVMMNSTAFAGTCYMYNPIHTSILDYYGNGTALAYFPIGVNEEALEQLIRHEAGGHGFAKLADEYGYRNNGQITENEKYLIEVQEDFGWYKNIDLTNNQATIKWHHFISDSRYTNEKIGAYEGAHTYWTGVWRPTEDSAMNSGIGKYNPPSREAIYYRIHKLAYGNDWEYDYEEFVKYDAVNRSTATRSNNSVERQKYQMPEAPIATGKTWKEAMR